MTTYGDIKFSPDSLRNGSKALQEVIDYLLGKTEELLDEVAKSHFLGKRDTLGQVASVLYEAVIELAKQCILNLLESFLEHAFKLDDAADIYERAELDNANAGSTMVTQGPAGYVPQN